MVARILAWYIKIGRIYYFIFFISISIIMTDTLVRAIIMIKFTAEDVQRIVGNEPKKVCAVCGSKLHMTSKEINVKQ